MLNGIPVCYRSSFLNTSYYAYAYAPATPYTFYVATIYDSAQSVGRKHSAQKSTAVDAVYTTVCVKKILAHEIAQRQGTSCIFSVTHPLNQQKITKRLPTNPDLHHATDSDKRRERPGTGILLRQHYTTAEAVGLGVPETSDFELHRATRTRFEFR